MTVQELQNWIDVSKNDPEKMLKIGKSYAEGSVLLDPTAAEAWLIRVIDLGDIPEAAEAMRILGIELGKTDQILSDMDYEQICRELNTTQGEKRKYLEKLELLGTEKQRGNMTKRRCNNDADFVY